METIERREREAIYAIQLAGKLSPVWSDWFDGLSITVTGEERGDPKTLLVGPVKDQASLRSLLNRIWNLNLTILFVQRAEPEANPDRERPRQGAAQGGPDGDSHSRNQYT